MRISDWSSDVCSSDLQRPFDADRGIVPQQGLLPFGGVIICAFILEIGGVGQRQKAVRKAGRHPQHPLALGGRSEEHTSELQSLMRISYAVFCLKKKNT